MGAQLMANIKLTDQEAQDASIALQKAMYKLSIEITILQRKRSIPEPVKALKVSRLRGEYAALRILLSALAADKIINGWQND
jgi:hypothetical protein